MSQASSSGSHGSQRSHLRPMHPGILRLPVLIRHSGPSPDTSGLQWWWWWWWWWLPGLQFLPGTLLSLNKGFHHSLQLHGPAGWATPGTRGGRWGWPLRGRVLAALQRGGLGGARTVQGGGRRGQGPRTQAEGWWGMPGVTNGLLLSRRAPGGRGLYQAHSSAYRLLAGDSAALGTQEEVVGVSPRSPFPGSPRTPPRGPPSPTQSEDAHGGRRWRGAGEPPLSGRKFSGRGPFK